jgi:tetratricopeptide (TPR) repeat protein
VFLRRDQWILGSVLLFGVVFVVAATWFGKQDRARYRLEPLPPLAPEEVLLVESLGILTPRYPELLPWIRGDAATRAQLLDAWERTRGTDDEGLHAVSRAVVSLLEGRAEGVAAATSVGGGAVDRELAFLRSLALARTGARHQAITVLEEVAAELGDDPDVLYVLGDLLLDAGRAKDARAVVERLVSRSPRYPKAQRLLGEVCLATHDAGRAKRAFLDVLQLAPDDPEARRQVRVLDGAR